MRRAGWIRVTHPCAGRLPKQTPRLACVKPVASVHPEPGSNSSLYVLCLLLDLSSIFIFCLILTGFYRLADTFFIDGSFFVPVQFIIASFNRQASARLRKDRCTAMSVWNVFKDRIA